MIEADSFHMDDVTNIKIAQDFICAVGTFIILKLKLITLVVIATYFIIVLDKFNVSNNWLATRQLGLLQGQSCDVSYGYHYSVVNTFAKGDVPVCFRSSNTDKDTSFPTLCVDSDVLIACQAAFAMTGNDPLNSDNYNNQFNSTSRQYIPNGIWIIIFCCFSTLLTIFCDNSDIFGCVKVGFFASARDKSMMSIVNHFAILFIAGFLFAAVDTYILIKTENCQSAYIPVGPNDHFCSILNGCGGGLGSVIYPEGILVTQFKEIALALAIILLLSTIIQILYNRRMYLLMRREMLQVLPMQGELFDMLDEDENLGIDNIRIRGRQLIDSEESSDIILFRSGRDDVLQVGDRYIDEHGELFESSEVLNRNRQAELNGHSEESSNETILRHMTMISERQRMINSWKIVPNFSQLSCRNECSICLFELFPGFGGSTKYPSSANHPISPAGKASGFGDSAGCDHCGQESPAINGDSVALNIDPSTIPVSGVSGVSTNIDMDGAALSPTRRKPSESGSGSAGGGGGGGGLAMVASGWHAFTRGRTTSAGAATSHASGESNNNNNNTILDVNNDNGIHIDIDASAAVQVQASDVVVEVKCGHIFHKSCILVWCLHHDSTTETCPVCRRSMVTGN